ncbi:hypothetical protein EMPS_04509 [Entomortierella parvispora]|uniref:Adhesin domain-containing protein n=1 Tax=Entomortierella parvispora TaxID=205924 RepID=A0A9P3H9D4_9FUNG|nr:hypothetical protein EMPS_04509 [Entomortierella parvispora]
MDTKKSHQPSDQWDANLEQEAFGNQAPYASDSKVKQDTYPDSSINEQEAFGNQAPYAAGSSTRLDDPRDYQDLHKYRGTADEEAPYLAHPYRPDMMIPQHAIQPTVPSSATDHLKAESFPSEAPPMYSSEPAATPLVAHAAVAPLAPPQRLQSPQSDTHSTLFPFPPSENHPRAMRSLPSLQRSSQHQHSTPTGDQQAATSIPLAAPPPGLTDDANAPYSAQSPLQQQQLPFPFTSQSYGAVSPHASSTPHCSRSIRSHGSSRSSTSSDSSDSENDELLSDRQRKNRYPIRCKHGKSKCSKRILFLAMLAGTLVYYIFGWLMEDPCETSKRLGIEEEMYAFLYSENTTISLGILDGIPGNILIKELDDWGEGTVYVYVFSTSADHNVIDDIIYDYKLLPSMDTVQWNTRLRPGMEASEKQLERIKKTCTRSNIVITLPKVNKGVRALNLFTSQGDIAVQWKNLQILSDEVSLHAADGNIILDGLSTKRKTDIVVSGEGSVSGLLSTAEIANISTDVGHIDLELDTDIGLIEDSRKNLDISLSTKTKGHINLVHTRDYSGRFALNSGLGTAILVCPFNSSMPVFTKKSNAHIEGWITEDGSIPRKDTPVVKASTYEGSISMTILDNFIPGHRALETPAEPKD